MLTNLGPPMMTEAGAAPLDAWQPLDEPAVPSSSGRWHVINMSDMKRWIFACSVKF